MARYLHEVGGGGAVVARPPSLRQGGGCRAPRLGDGALLEAEVGLSGAALTSASLARWAVAPRRRRLLYGGWDRDHHGGRREFFGLTAGRVERPRGRSAGTTQNERKQGVLSVLPSVLVLLEEEPAQAPRVTADSKARLNERSMHVLNDYALKGAKEKDEEETSRQSLKEGASTPVDAVAELDRLGKKARGSPWKGICSEWGAPISPALGLD